MTLGEERVRVSFNPSSESEVDEIKRLTADLINRCAAHKDQSEISGEELRLWSLAMTDYEQACMWAVKAVTIPKTRREEAA